jgi:NAD(P)-dependent dehydrogenase (short-subunit alcohol dehydrogenase family)
MDLGLAGRRALVTGASKGIGLSVTRALVAEGATVVAGARTAGDALRELAAGGSVEPVEVDLARPDGPAELVAAAREGGPIEILVNNVGGVTPRLDGFAAVTDDQWEATLQLTLMAAVRTTRAVVADMLAAGRGTIVTTSSVNAFLPDPAVIDYCAAKAALTNFCKALSKELGPAGIRVNTVSPGPVSTGLWLGDDGVAKTIAKTAGGEPDAIAKQAVAGTATGRFTTPEEVADLVVMLCGDRAANVTGADFVIDGGLIQTL